MKPAQGHDRDFVHSLEKGLEVLRCFSLNHQQLTAGDVARMTAVTPAAARRSLLTLERLGYVQRTDNLFQMTPKVLQLGYAYMSMLPWTDIARPMLEELTRETGESSAAGIVHEQNFCAVVRIPPPGIISIQVTIGSWLPAAQTATGRAIVAFWSDAELREFLSGVELRRRTPFSVTSKHDLLRHIDAARSSGYAVVDQEIELGLISIAVPVFDISRKVVGGINVSSNTIRSSVSRLRQDMLPRLHALSRTITAGIVR